MRRFRMSGAAEQVLSAPVVYSTAATIAAAVLNGYSTGGRARRGRAGGVGGGRGGKLICTGFFNFVVAL